MPIAVAIGEGSRCASHYIHASRSRDVALLKYAGRARTQKGDRIAVIDLSKLDQSQIIDGPTAVADAQDNGRAFRFANADHEVVLRGVVPPSAIIDVLEFKEDTHMNSADRFQTPPRRIKRLDHDLDWRDTRSCAMKRRRYDPPNAFNTSYPVLKADAVCKTFKVAGVSHYQRIVNTLQVGDSILLHKDDANLHDRFAVRVETSCGKQIGFVEKTGTLDARFFACK